MRYGELSDFDKEAAALRELKVDRDMGLEDLEKLEGRVKEMEGSGRVSRAKERLASEIDAARRARWGRIALTNAVKGRGAWQKRKSNIGR